nr:TIR domain-containing protein [Gluconobacter cerinus]
MECCVFFFFYFKDLLSVVEKAKEQSGLDEDRLFEKHSGGIITYADVFISYSYRDDKIIPLALSLLLEKEGCKVYLPKLFSRKKGKTPTKLDIELTHSALSVSSSLVLVNGPETTRSQWIPWEIGFIAGKTGKVCVFDVGDDEKKPRNSEFLNLYPKIHPLESKIIVDNSKSIMDWVYDKDN